MPNNPLQIEFERQNELLMDRFCVMFERTTRESDKINWVENVELFLKDCQQKTVEVVREMINIGFQGFYNKHQDCVGTRLDCNPEKDIVDLHEDILSELNKAN